jgi:PPOX class probable F420-dependent enzyme
MLEPDVRRVLDSTPIAHVATVLPDGSPHCTPMWIGTRGEQIVVFTHPNTRKARNLRRDPRVAISISPADDPWVPVVVRGRVVEWIDGEDGWAIVDQLAMKYVNAPYSREFDRHVAVIEPERQTVGVR